LKTATKVAASHTFMSQYLASKPSRKDVPVASTPPNMEKEANRMITTLTLNLIFFIITPSPDKLSRLFHFITIKAMVSFMDPDSAPDLHIELSADLIRYLRNSWMVIEGIQTGLPEML